MVGHNVGHILEDLQILNSEGPILVFLLAVGSLQLGQILENIPFELDAVQTGDGGGGAEPDLFIANSYGFFQHNQATSSSGT